ncbi:Transferase [Penicillium soppii]|uniref:Transferase n=1 Tax=Penicillium soppii TaxID=69789 RepID=UPI002547A6E5|nr:Transferase [Penicillium soppii]KAJ5875778.1 Transferase [Penicillium soppii]
MFATCCFANSATDLPPFLPTTCAKEASSRQIILDNAIPFSDSNTEAFSQIFESNRIIPGLDKKVTSQRFSFPASKVRALKDAYITARSTDQDPAISSNDVLPALLATYMN